MRRRNVQQSDDEDTRDRLMSFSSSVRSFDMYPKVEEDSNATVQTNTGGTVSLISGFIMMYLFLCEAADFVVYQPQEHLQVDTTRIHELPVNLNLTLHRIPCKALHLDVMDDGGDQQVDILDSSVVRVRVDENGDRLVEVTAVGDESPKVQKNVMKKENEQEEQQEDGVGCMVSGTIKVNKIAGNIHIAIGKSTAQRGHHIHEFTVTELKEFNVSHTINHISFGEQYDGRESPLAGVSKITKQSEQLYQYFIKVVPTVYRYGGTTLYTNQYSVLPHEMVLDILHKGAVGGRIPGLFFRYDISPFLIEVTRGRRSFLDFLTSVCAIVGGVFAVSGLLDSVLYHLGCSLDKLQKKGGQKQ